MRAKRSGKLWAVRKIIFILKFWIEVSFKPSQMHLMFYLNKSPTLMLVRWRRYFEFSKRSFFLEKNWTLFPHETDAQIRVTTQYEGGSCAFESKQWGRNWPLRSSHSLFVIKCRMKTGCSERAAFRPSDTVGCDLCFERNSPIEATHRVSSRFDALLSAAKCSKNKKRKLLLSHFGHSVRTRYNKR